MCVLRPLAIATFLWCTFILDWPEDEGPRFFWISNAVIWGFSGLMAAIPLNHYDTAGGWCWIDQDGAAASAPLLLPAILCFLLPHLPYPLCPIALCALFTPPSTCCLQQKQISSHRAAGYGDAMRFGTFYIIIWLVVLAIVAFYFSLIRHLHAVALLPEEKERCCYQLRSVTAILIKGDPSQADTHTIDQVPIGRLVGDQPVVPVEVATSVVDAELQVYLARMIRYMRRQCLFPVVLIVCWIVPTINRVCSSSLMN
jgi:hypothetical protein